MPKYHKNRPQIHEKSANLAPKRDFERRRAKNLSKAGKNLGKVWKSGKKHPQMEQNNFTAGLCEALSSFYPRAKTDLKYPKGKRFTTRVRVPEGTPAHCDAERISAGVLCGDCVAALFKFFNALLGLCRSSIQTLESRPSILLRIRSVLSKRILVHDLQDRLYPIDFKLNPKDLK